MSEILEGIGKDRNVEWEVCVRKCLCVYICVWVALSNRSVVEPYSLPFTNGFLLFFLLLVMKGQVHCIPRRPRVHVVQDD